MAEDQEEHKKNIIIVKRVKKSHEEHHGGMWKVAYADFVTAMMAFFLLMWLVNTVSNDKLKGLAEYFTPVIGLKGQTGVGLDGGSDPQSAKGLLSSKSSTDSVTKGSPKNGPLDSQVDSKDSVTESEQDKLVSVMNNLEQDLEGTTETSKYRENIQIEKNPEGIRIQIMDSINRSVFVSGSSDIQPYMMKFLDVVANLIKTLPNYISIEGHTSPGSDPAVANIDQWTLSINRADSIRKYYEKRIKPEQVLKIIGRANTEPYDIEDPNNPKNARIVIILLNPDVVGKYKNAAPN